MARGNSARRGGGGVFLNLFFLIETGKERCDRNKWKVGAVV